MIDKKNYSQLIIEYLLDEIKNGRLKPGDKIPTERELCESLGVSRPPIREALKALSTIGILTTRQGGGSYVNTYDASYLQGILRFATLFSNELLVDFIQLRMALESEAAKLAALHADEAVLDRLESLICEREKLALDYQGHTYDVQNELDRLDYDFHIAITEASGNVVFTEFIRSITLALKEHQHYSALQEKSPDRSNKYHRQIFEAIESHNPDLAGLLMYDHLASVKKAVIEYQKQHGNSSTTPSQKS